VAQIVDRAEARPPGDRGDRLVGGLRMVLGRQDPLFREPLERCGSGLPLKRRAKVRGARRGLPGHLAEDPQRLFQAVVDAAA